MLRKGNYSVGVLGDCEGQDGLVTKDMVCDGNILACRDNL